MLKVQAAFLAVGLGFSSQAGAAIVGPDAALCANGTGPAVLVRVVGLKNRAGTVRVRTFGGSPSTWFNKKSFLKRVEIPTPQSGSVEFCMPVAKPGIYAADIRHDVNNNSDTDMADGGGSSGNPEVSLLDVVFGRRPPAEQVSFRVGEGITTVTIIVKYKQGSSFKPIAQLQTTRR
jgi:uncharacterized protein (DUF2141 family)